MAQVDENKNCLRCAKIVNLVEDIKDGNETIEKVQKGLKDYLETKRLYFPRFFFLSNDNLLEILSETKDPSRIQPHLKKCFEGIQSLTFDDKKRITEMVSSEKEVCALQRFQDDNNDGNVDASELKKFMVEPAKAKGAVEVWLVELENAMVESIRAITFASKGDFVKKKFAEWLQLWPGMTVICMFNVFWSGDITKGLKEQGNPFLAEYKKKMDADMSDMIVLVRGEISKIVRFTLEALIVIYVHNVDTVQMLSDKGIDRDTDFDWLVQLRYFTEMNPDKDFRHDVFIRISNSHLAYNYEYLGNSSRLVITPLTDRCYRTCCATSPR
jgi:dynein heavy chain